LVDSILDVSQKDFLKDLRNSGYFIFDCQIKMPHSSQKRA
jgi:hypothetical protein